MSGSFTLRLSVAIAILLVFTGIVYLTANHGIPHMVMPGWHLKEMPVQLGDWTWNGETKKVDSRLFNQIGAKEVENREYRNSTGAVIVLHSALFDDSEKGLRHSPLNCYRDAGWTRTKTEVVPMGTDPEKSPKICICYWQKDKEQCLTGHWYQVGEDQVFDREKGFTALRIKRFGRNEWPPMVKVLLQTSLTNPEADTAHLKDIGQRIYLWLSQLRKSS